MKFKNILLITLGLLIIVQPVGLYGRNPYSQQPHNPSIQTAAPAYCTVSHDIGELVLAVTNSGTFGANGSSGGQDCFTGRLIPSCEYPKSSRTVYLWSAAFWVGAIVGRDTVVSVGSTGWGGSSEMNPEVAPLGQIMHRSIIDPGKEEFENAISEQDYIAVYYDTCLSCPGVGNDVVDGRPHRPLNIEITQRTFAWSYDYAEDFVLFDYSIRNIGHERLRQVYLGIYVDADVHDIANRNGYSDDICGFRVTAPASYVPAYCPPVEDTVFAAYIADNDGDLKQQNFVKVPHLTATRIVRSPSDSLRVSFNWWVSNGNAALDFGPQSIRGQRVLGHGGTGTPSGDRNKYHFMRNGEFDYDQIETADISALDTFWLPANPQVADDIANGFDTRYLLSFGPFDIEPGQTLPLSFAYVAGADLHTNPNNADHLPPGNWQTYYDGLDFTDLDLNSTWADWIYDNPGIDSDSDGYAGEMLICNLGDDSTLKCDSIIDTTADTTIVDCYWEFDVADTIWRKGDGIPDFRGASPPPAPVVRIEPSVGSVRVIWNGARSETTRDIFSREFDFEGYRIYLARDSRRASFSMLASYDLENFNKFVYDTVLNEYLLLETPFTLAELRTLYGDGNAAWHPLSYPRSHPYTLASSDSVFYFENQDYNRSILANDPINKTTPIAKVYPNAIKPVPPEVPFLVADSVPDSLHSKYLTDDGYFKYYEYEFTIENLLPTISYWINVTAFDYGSPSSGLASLETNPSNMPTVTYALESVDRVASEDLKVYVYPNPYLTDGAYSTRGFENRYGIDVPDRARLIHFANVPPKCTISIFSLDGDLVRELDHDIDPADPLANHETWNLITRNTQLVVSGLYYWTVVDDQGRTQVGKLSIIL